MQFRMANANDFPTLAHMRYVFCNEMGDGNTSVSKEVFCEQFIAFLQQGLSDKTWYYFVAEYNKEVIGHAFVKKIVIPPRPNAMSNTFGYLTNMYVKPEYRGKQIGSQLLQYSINYSKRDGMELLIVWPDDKSVDFYERMGFSLHEVRELRF